MYAAQVPGGVEVNLLSTAPQAFEVQGNGTADVGQSWELWLTDGDVNNAENTNTTTPNIIDLQGTATRESDGTAFTFAATVNINQSNRGALPVSDPSQPGQNPICKQRILEEGGIALQLFAGSALHVTVDPRGWFNLPIDFSSLPPVASDLCQIDKNPILGSADYCIPDTNFASGAAGRLRGGPKPYTGIFTGGPAAYALGYSQSP